jgi:hypothetical protein
MIICNPRSLAFALLIAALPVGFAFAGGSGGRGGAIGAGVGAAGMGSAAIGGGAGQVGGGPPAGLVGGGSPNSNNPGGNGSVGTGNPSLNAVGGGPGGNGTNTPGIPNARTGGSVIGGGVGVPSPSPFGSPGGTAPEALSSQRQSTDSATAPKAVQVVAEEAQFSPTGLAKTGPDGVSTVIVAARPCGTAAHETDGTTTCIGIPGESARAKKHR